MAKPRRTLIALEILSLLVWLGLAGAYAARAMEDQGPVPLDTAALVVGTAEERWSGIFFQDQPRRGRQHPL